MNLQILQIFSQILSSEENTKNVCGDKCCAFAEVFQKWVFS